MGLIRKAIFVGGALFLLPSPPDNGGAAAHASDQLRNASYIVAASSALADMTSFCVRQPATCAVAGELAARAELKTKYSIKLLYEWATKDKPVAKPSVALSVAADPLVTGSTDEPAGESQSTLNIDDLIPPWLGPQPKKG